MQLNRPIRLVLAVGLAITLACSFVGTGSAHEHRDVADGRFQFVVGFLDEPAISGFKNGLDLRISDTQATPVAEGEEGTPVEGAEATLQAEVIYQDQKMTLTLEPRWNTPGAYDGYFIPMAPGDYSFHITGTIDGVAIDETFTSSPNGFSSVLDATDLQFPKPSAVSGSAGPAYSQITSGILTDWS